MRLLFWSIVLIITVLSCRSSKQLENDSDPILSIQEVGMKPVLVRQPYLQMVREQSAIITWKTDTTSTACHASIVEAFDHNDRIFLEGEVNIHEGNDFNEVQITGLQPDTKYLYTIYSNGYELAGGESYYFKTAPNHNSSFSFYALGDIGANSKWCFANESADQIAALEIKPDFGLGLGDIVYPKGESKNYDNHLFIPFQDVFINTPFYPVAGNHDWMAEDFDENFKKEWNLPNNEHYYHFSYANTLFIGLDSRDGNFYDLNNQTKWLEKVLIDNKGKYKWTVVYLHHNGKSCTYKKDYEHVVDLYNLFSSHKVDLVLNGHAHTYERLKPYNSDGNIDVSRADQSEYQRLNDQFISITLGADGKLNKKWKADPHNKANCEDGNIVAHSEHVGSFGLITIDGNSLSFQGINSFDGQIFDTFKITK